MNRYQVIAKFWCEDIGDRFYAESRGKARAMAAYEFECEFTNPMSIKLLYKDVPVQAGAECYQPHEGQEPQEVYRRTEGALSCYVRWQENGVYGIHDVDDSLFCDELDYYDAVEWCDGLIDSVHLQGGWDAWDKERESK